MATASAEGFRVQIEERQDIRGAWYAWLVGECSKKHPFQMAVGKFLSGQRCRPCRMAAKAQEWAQVADAVGYDVRIEMADLGGRRERILVGTCDQGHQVRIRPARMIAGERCGLCYRTAQEAVATRLLTEAKTEGYTLNAERRSSTHKKSELWLVGLCPSGHSIEIRGSHFSRGQRCRACYHATGRSATVARYLASAKAEGYRFQAKVVGYDVLLVGECPQGHSLRMKSYTFMSGGRCGECKKEQARQRHLRQAISEGYVVTLEMRDNTRQGQAWLVGTCPEGHQYAARIATFNNGSRCRTCARSGFDQSRPADFYLIATPAWQGDQMLQFGISTRLPGRLADHRRTGFTQVLYTLHSDSGSTIVSLERMLKHTLRLNNIPTCLARGRRFDGSSEAICVSDLPQTMLDELITHLVERMLFDGHTLELNPTAGSNHAINRAFPRPSRNEQTAA